MVVAAPAAAFTLADAAGLASGFGSLLGGLGSAFGGKKKGPTMQDQINGQIQLQRKQFEQTMANADRFGIHRLVALGAMPSGGASFSVGGGEAGNWATDLPEMGQNIGRALDAFSGPEQRRVQDVLTRQSIERGDLENELLRSEIALKHAQTGPATPFGQVVTVPDEVTAGSHGYEAGVSQANQRLMFNQDGSTIRAMGPDLAGAGLDDGPANWWYQLSRTLPDMVSADANYFTKRAGKKLRNWYEDNKRRKKMYSQFRK